MKTEIYKIKQVNYFDFDKNIGLKKYVLLKSDIILSINQFMIKNTYNSEWKTDPDIDFNRINIDQPLFL